MSENGNTNDQAGLTPADIHALLALFDDSDWQELELKLGDSSLYVSKNAGGRGGAAGGPSGAREAAKPGETPPTDAATQEASPAAEQAPPVAADALPAGCVAVTAPNVGTFYRSPKPGEPPYVELGQTVAEDSEVCLIEVMKLFTPLNAGVAGTVRAICVEDGQMIEYGQVLMHIEAAR